MRYINLPCGAAGGRARVVWMSHQTVEPIVGEYPYFHIHVSIYPQSSSLKMAMCGSLGLCVITLLPVVTPPHFLPEPLPHFL